MSQLVNGTKCMYFGPLPVKILFIFITYLLIAKCLCQAVCLEGSQDVLI